MINTINVSKPSIGKEEICAVSEVLKSGFLAQGANVEEFENKFAQYIGSKYAIAVSNGTAALHISLLAHGIKNGDEVITTSFSFIATANSILMTGATPVFVDIGDDYNIDHKLIERKITKKTKAIMPVHLFGLPANMYEINRIAKKHKLVVIEDAAQAHGAIYEDKSVVGSKNTSAFSFYATKNITCGEGGIITTNSKRIADKIRLLRSHGSKVRYYHDEFGYNYRMTNIQAAIGVVQLNKLKKFNQIRQRNAKLYTEKIKKEGISLPIWSNNCVYHQFTIRVTNKYELTRDQLSEKLKNSGVNCGIFYPVPIHKQRFYKSLGYNDKLPKCEKYAKEVISLPVHQDITLDDIRYIIDCIH